MFAIKNGVSAPEFQKLGGDWEPHAHFTGNPEDRDEVEAVQGVINRHSTGIVAHYVYRPYPAMYSVELQFQNEGQGIACRQDYASLFAKNGKLKKAFS